MIKLIIVLIALITFTHCQTSNAQLKIVNAFPSLSFEQPVDIQNANDGTNRLFIVSQPGKIYVIENNPNTNTKEVFLDISDKVLFGGEQGLLGLAFHPNYKNNGFFFVNYTTNNPRRTVISRFKVSSNDRNKADKNTEVILMEINQPYSNHNGGQLAFGPDGYLYISLGDGGSAGDPQNNAQNFKSLLGKILRIDVNKPSNNLHYSIPSDNPFKGNTNGLKEEIYAWGLRNVWRFSFDKVTNRLWAADVGQNLWEEIDIIEKGKNYGWRIMEGFHCYNPAVGCNTTNLTLPIWEYGHNDEGGYSITGGYVYRGSNANEIYGKYIYGDFVTGNIWALDYYGKNVNNKLLLKTNYSIATFGIDENNELYFSDYTSGKIYKFVGSPVTNLGSIKFESDYKLGQNYPNPFPIKNLSSNETTIEYSIPFTESNSKDYSKYITLKIYDLLGREVATLVDESKEAGNYVVKLSLEKYKLSSGIYFYALQTGNKLLVKKMIVTK